MVFHVFTPRRVVWHVEGRHCACCHPMRGRRWMEISSSLRRIDAASSWTFLGVGWTSPISRGGVCSSAFAYLSCLSSCANHWSSGTISIPRSNKGNTSSARARMCCRMSCSQRPQLSSCQRAVADAQTPRRATVGSAGWAAWLAGKGSEECINVSSCIRTAGDYHIS